MGECLCPCLLWDLGMSQSLLCVLWRLPVGTEGLALGGEVSCLPEGLNSFYQAEKWAHVPCLLLEIESQESNYRVPSRPQGTDKWPPGTSWKACPRPWQRGDIEGWLGVVFQR